MNKKQDILRIILLIIIPIISLSFIINNYKIYNKSNIINNIDSSSIIYTKMNNIIDTNTITKFIIIIVISVVLVTLTKKLIRNYKIKKIINIIVYILYILIIVVTLQRIIYKDNRYLNFYIYKVSSGSMEKTLHVNDYILVKQKKSYKVGDIITFNKEGRTITHRIIKINNDSVITKGDANFTEDKSINNNQIIGKVIVYGFILNIYMEYISYIIIVYSTLYIIIDLLIKKRNKFINVT